MTCKPSTRVRGTELVSDSLVAGTRLAIRGIIVTVLVSSYDLGQYERRNKVERENVPVPDPKGLVDILDREKFLLLCKVKVEDGDDS